MTDDIDVPDDPATDSGDEPSGGNDSGPAGPPPDDASDEPEASFLGGAEPINEFEEV